MYGNESMVLLLHIDGNSASQWKMFQFVFGYCLPQPDAVQRVGIHKHILK